MFGDQKEKDEQMEIADIIMPVVWSKTKRKSKWSICFHFQLAVFFKRGGILIEDFKASVYDQGVSN